MRINRQWMQTLFFMMGFVVLPSVSQAVLFNNIITESPPIWTKTGIEKVPLMGEAATVICYFFAPSPITGREGWIEFELPSDVEMIAGEQKSLFSFTTEDVKGVDINNIPISTLQAEITVVFKQAGEKHINCSLYKMDGEMFSGGGGLDLIIGDTESFFLHGDVSQPPLQPQLSPQAPQSALLNLNTTATLGAITPLSCETQVLDDSVGEARLQWVLPDTASLASGELDSGWQAIDPSLRLESSVIFQNSGEQRVQCQMTFRRAGATYAGATAVAVTQVQETDEAMTSSQTLIKTLPYPSITPTALLEALSAPQSPTTTGYTPGYYDIRAILPDLLTLEGHWRFTDRNGQPAALPLTVEVFRADTGAQVAACITQPEHNGFYACKPFHYSPGTVLVTRVSAYLHIKGEGVDEVLQVIDPQTGLPYTAVSAPHLPNQAYRGTSDMQADITDSLVGYFSNNNISTPDNSERAFWVMQELLGVWRYVWEHTQRMQLSPHSAGSATVLWHHTVKPTLPYQTASYRHGLITLGRDAPWSASLIRYAYAHAIRDRIYRQNVALTPVTFDHCSSEVALTVAHEDLSCAWAAGWAAFFSAATEAQASTTFDILLSPTPGKQAPDMYRMDLELAHSSQQDQWMGGANVPARIAAALWDLFDQRNIHQDETAGETLDQDFIWAGFEPLWDTFFHTPVPVFFDPAQDFSKPSYLQQWVNRGYYSNGTQEIDLLRHNRIFE